MHTYRLELLLDNTRRWGLVVTHLATGGYVGLDGEVSAGRDPDGGGSPDAFNPTAHVLPLVAGAPPRPNLLSATIRLAPDAPAGWYSYTLHTIDEARAIADPNALGLADFYHDPEGRLDEDGRPVAPPEPVGVVNVFQGGRRHRIHRVEG